MLLLAFGSLNLLKGCLCLAVTDALKSKQRWDDTIMIVSAGARIPILYRPHAASSGLALTRCVSRQRRDRTWEQPYARTAPHSHSSLSLSDAKCLPPDPLRGSKMTPYA